MKKIFTKSCYLIAAAIFFIGFISNKAFAQFTGVNVETGGLYTAIAKDASNNLFVTRVKPGSPDTYIIEKYVVGAATPSSPTVVYTGLTHEVGDFPWGLAISSTGVIYLSTDFTRQGDFSGGAILKLTKNVDGNYDASYYQRGRYFSALAFDANNNLYTTEYDAAHSTFAVVKYPAGTAALTLGTVLYDMPASGVGYTYPTGLAVAPNGDIFVGTPFSNDPSITSGGILYRLKAASSYSATAVSTNRYVTALAVDAAGNLLSSENSGGGYHLVKYTGGAGTPATVYSPLHTNGFYYPWGISIFNNNRIFVNDGDDGTNGGALIQLSSSDATLTNLTVSSGTLKPAFAPATLTYADTVTNATTSITLTPTATNASATIKVNGTTVTSGTASAAIALAVGPNTITTVVTAYNGTTTKTYTTTVVRTGSNDALLTKISTNGGSPLTLVSGTSYRNYTTSVPGSMHYIQVTATTQEPNATLKINGFAQPSGVASPNLPLHTGTNNVINTVVTAQDGITTKTYTITVTKPASPDANLANLFLSTGTLNPAFATATTSYTATVPNSTPYVTITPTVEDTSARIKVNGVAVASGQASGTINLNVGPNTITTLVTAENGSTKTYTVVVTKAGSNVATLSKIATNTGVALVQVSGPDYKDYAISVPNSTSTVQITATATDPTATIKINGVTVASGVASSNIPLVVGANVINTVVTAQDGVTVKTYGITITRAPSSNDNLSALTTTAGALDPAFSSGNTSYDASVANTVTSVTVTPTAADATATIMVNGAAVTSGHASAAIPLSLGSNTVTIKVTAQDGSTYQNYTINVNRALSSNALLSKLATNTGVALVQVSGPDYRDYTLSLPNATASMTVTPTAQDATATISVNGSVVASGTASQVIALPVGTTTINVVVSAQDDETVKTYSIAVTRAATMALYKPAGDALATDGITVHPGITPNGDGQNDVFTIDGLSAYPDNKVMIMNRSGAVVYEAKGYDNQTKFFDGHSNKNGALQLTGTYFYSLEYKVGDVVKHKTGFVVLKY